MMNTLAMAYIHQENGAGDRARTDDLLVGNETFYQLNYARL